MLALRRRGANDLGWTPRNEYRLMPQDRLFVLVTRAGLSRGANVLPAAVAAAISAGCDETGSPAAAQRALRSGQVFHLVLLSPL